MNKQSIGRKIYYALHSGKNPKFAYYAKSIVRQAWPKSWLNSRLEHELAKLDSRPDKEYIMQRVNYYCKLTVDRPFIDIRSAHGATCIPKKDILRHLLTMRRQQQHYLFGYISDQAPRWKDIHLFLPFLNHETPVFTGGERIMRKMHEAVFYIDMERMRRGYYTCTFKLITREPEKLEENEVTRQFFVLLEQSIRRQPAFYLWTHKRWKRTKEEFDEKYMIVNGHTIPKEQGVYGS